MENNKPEPTTHTAPPIEASSGSEPGPPPSESEPDYPGGEPGFIPLEDEPEEGAEPEESGPLVEPFTGEEIVNGTALILSLGLRFQTKEEAQAFVAAFKAGVVPMLPPAAVLDALRVGEALAKYGIGRNRIPGMGSLAELPEWLRLVLGGLVLAMSAYGGINAAKATRVDMALSSSSGADDY